MLKIYRITLNETDEIAIQECVYGHVICAEDEEQCRAFASTFPGMEGEHVWLDPTLTTIEELGEAKDGLEEGILLTDDPD